MCVKSTCLVDIIVKSAAWPPRFAFPPAVPAMETPMAASPSETGNGTPPNLFGTPPAVSDAGSSSGGVGMSSSGPPGSINVEELYGEMGSVASVPEGSHWLLPFGSWFGVKGGGVSFVFVGLEDGCRCCCGGDDVVVDVPRTRTAPLHIRNRNHAFTPASSLNRGDAVD